MKLYNRYLFSKTSTVFLGITTILVSLIWFSKTIPFVKFITENGVELSKFFALFLLILPWMLLFIIPISLFIAVLMVYNRFISNNEISILKNSGLTKLQICKSTIVLALLSSAFCLVISLYLMPYANKKLRLSRTDLKNNYASLFFNAKTFETINNLTIYTRTHDINDNLAGIMLYDEKQSDYSVTITAKAGKIKVENDSALLYMTDGTLQKFNYASRKSEILYFDSYVFNLNENSTVKEGMKWKRKERYLHELLHPEEETSEAEFAEYNAELHERFTNPLLPLIFTMIAVASILRGDFSRRGNTRNTISAIILTVVFLTIHITSQDLVAVSQKLAIISYGNLALFLAISLLTLADTNHRIKLRAKA